jgi:uncharacterized membrane protein YkvA (DUF1232 family)
MQNGFFQMALQKASKMLGKKSRLLLLLVQLGNKLRGVNWQAIKSEAVKEKFFILGRLVKAYTLGRYRIVPWKAMLSVVAALIYFVSPIDLIPDFIPVTGLTDDVGVLLWVYNSLSKEVNDFLVWESNKLNTQFTDN